MKTPIYQLPGLSADQLPYLNNIISKISHSINNVEFGTTEAPENIWCTFLPIDGGVANEICSASHGLKKKPAGTLVVWQDRAAIMFKPSAGSADTDETIYFAFNTDSVSAVLLLI